MVRYKVNISHIPEKRVNNMFILQFVRFSNANKIFALSSITFHVHVYMYMYTRDDIGW